jgi:hypothetical protein
MQTEGNRAPLRLVPFNATWIAHDKIDVHAIYRRPRYKADEFGDLYRERDKDGLPTWDITGPLPVRRHNDWIKKGFEYVTLADRESLAVAARFGTLPDGMTAKDFDQHQTGGPWNYRRYVLGIGEVNDAALAQLEADCRKYGSEAVEQIRRSSDPTFVLPDKLRDIPHPSLAATSAKAAPPDAGKTGDGAKGKDKGAAA